MRRHYDPVALITALVLLSLLAVTGFLLYRQSGLSLADHDLLIARADEAREAVTTLRLNLLTGETETLGNIDDTMQAVDQAFKAVNMLSAAAASVDLPDTMHYLPQLESSWLDYESICLDFISNAAVLDNSLRAIPGLLHNMDRMAGEHRADQDQAREAARHLAQDFTAATLLYAATGDPLVKHHSMDLAHVMAAPLPGASTPDSLLDVLARHGRILHGAREKRQDMIARLKNHSIDTALMGIHDELGAYLEIAEAARQAARIPITWLSLAAALCTFFLLLRLARTATKLRRAILRQSQLEMALDEHAIVSSTDAQGRIIGLNDQFAQISGFTLEQLRGKTHRVVNSGYHPPEFFADLWQTIQSGRPWHGLVRNLAQNGDHYWVEATIVPIADEDGNIEQYISIRTDVTKLIEVQEKLGAATRAAELANQAKSAFLANMSHEIRTPLNGVVGMAQLLQDTNLDSEQEEQVDIISKSSVTLLALINNILDLSKIEAGQMELAPTTFSLSDLVTEIAVGARGVAWKNGIAVNSLVDPELPSVLHGDGDKLRQVLLNLLGNSAKFTREGEIRLEARLHSRDTEKVWVDVVVEDTGVGIAPEYLPRIFEAFSQQDASTTREFGGTGLGMAICKKIIDLMGGEISVTSTVGEGTRFNCRLPFALVHDQPNAVGTNGAESDHTATEPVVDPSQCDPILVVDDNATNRLVVGRNLEKMGYRYETANDGIEALECLQAQTFSLVLMDCQMPRLDGYEATRRLRSMSRDAVSSLPVIALTANALAGDREKCEAAGMDSYLSKPIVRKDLAAAITRWIIRPTAQV